jgi:CAAX prenyl protease-like protein
MMAVERIVSLPPQLLYPIRFTLVSLLILLVSRPYIPLRPAYPLASVAIGAAVFVIWIAPDVLFGYRQHWLFENFLTGRATSSLPAGLTRNIPFVLTRVISCTILVPILEELFWRGWLMRWLIDNDFTRVPVGTYAPSAFWIVAVLFASEHGPYWEVGLITGVIYNWWFIRTRNLADCIWAHAVTNGILSVYVLLTDQWQYWL